MMQLLDGKTLAERLRANVKARVSKLSETPGLAILLVGNDPASHLYVSLKEKACEEVGMHFEKFLYNDDVSTEELIAKIKQLNARNDIHGILVQLPLPSQDENAIIATIAPNKDVDGFHAENQRLLGEGKPCLAPATALGIAKLIDSAGIDLQGLHAGVIGSDLFAGPLSLLLKDRGVTTDRLDPKHLSPEQTTTYDILISVVGQPGLVTSNLIKDGAIIIDVGTTRVNDETVGDVDSNVQEKKTGYLTPVPGGVGPMTVAMLLVNVLKAYQFQR